MNELGEAGRECSMRDDAVVDVDVGVDGSRGAMSDAGAGLGGVKEMEGARSTTCAL